MCYLPCTCLQLSFQESSGFSLVLSLEQDVGPFWEAKLLVMCLLKLLTAPPPRQYPGYSFYCSNLENVHITSLATAWGTLRLTPFHESHLVLISVNQVLQYLPLRESASESFSAAIKRTVHYLRWGHLCTGCSNQPSTTLSKEHVILEPKKANPQEVPFIRQLHITPATSVSLFWHARHKRLLQQRTVIPQLSCAKWGRLSEITD